MSLSRILSATWTAGLAISLLPALPAAAPGCAIPVFRYALERWEPDPHEIRVNPADLEPWKLALTKAAPAPNAYVVSSTGVAPGSVEIVMPQQAGAWFSGELKPGASGAALHSPFRQTIANDLASGFAISWIVLADPGDPEGDRMEKALRARLEALRGNVEMPGGEEIEASGYSLYYSVPLEFKSSVRRLSRNDPNEAWLVRQLDTITGLEKPGPLLAAAFGRGRVIGVPAAEVSEGLIDDLALFLGSACSCQVKQMNPGGDLLLAVDWEERLEHFSGLAEMKKAAATGTGAPAAKPGPVAAPKASPETFTVSPATPPASGGVNPLFVAAMAGALALGVAVILAASIPRK